MDDDLITPAATVKLTLKLATGLPTLTAANVWGPSASISFLFSPPHAPEGAEESRPYECSQVASSERGLGVDGYEAQLLCTLRTGLARLSDLTRRYPPE